LEPRAFDILLHLIEHRNDVVAKNDIMKSCWPGDLPTDSAFARAIMKIRRAIADEDPERPLIKTVHGVGYQFACRIELGTNDDPAVVPPAVPVESEGRRLVLLPIANATSDNSCGWVELGLMSLITQALFSVPDLSIVPLQDVFAALRGVATSDPPEAKLEAIESALGVTCCVWGELTGSEARFVLHFNLKTSSTSIHRGTVVGSDPAKMATDAALHLRQWLSPESDALTMGQSIDLGDPFHNQVFARALQCTREERLNEAVHLLEMLQEFGVRHLVVLHETARVFIALGRHGADEHLRVFEAAAQEAATPTLLAASHALRGALLEFQGRIAESVTATLEAVDIAQRNGLGDMTARLMVTCASRMAMGFDPRTDALLSHAMLRAERLSNRVVLCDAYCAAGRVAGFRNDWISALHHQLAAVAIADTMHEASRSWAYGALSWVQSELGLLEEAARSAVAGFRSARLSGAEPQQGLAAGQAALAYVASRRIRDTANLYRELQALRGDTSAAMFVAREAYCRAPLLCASDRFDEALERLTCAIEVSREQPRLLSRCQAQQLKVLMRARRFEELDAVCAAIRSSEHTIEDVRLAPLVDWALAFRDHLDIGKTEAAIRSLRATIRSQAASEVHAMISLDTAWIHLERGEVDEAAALVAPLQAWLDQSQPGLVVAGRLRYATGDFAGAVSTQRECLRRFSESTTAFHRALLDVYQLGEQVGAAQDAARLHEPLSVHWCIAADVLEELAPELGGRGTRVVV
jgi:tetratricopeptide (TPR) repeat protein